MLILVDGILSGWLGSDEGNACHCRRDSRQGYRKVSAAVQTVSLPRALVLFSTTLIETGAKKNTRRNQVDVSWPLF